MRDNTVTPYISLCSGYEGIGIGLHRCIPNLRPIAYCEREAFAVANLVKKIEGGHLDPAPVFTDVCSFPWGDFAPFMAGGILSFGFPCQPFSLAGKRKGVEDERWLFDTIADGIAILRPGAVFAENVEGLLSSKMPDGTLVISHCVERLEAMGYRVEAGIFSASETGAPHQRKRVFILGVAHDYLERIAQHGLSEPISEELSPVGDGGGDGGLAHSYCSGGREDRQPAEPRTEGDQQPSRDCRGLRERKDGEIWPSRPGQPQHGWEPPRVC